MKKDRQQVGLLTQSLNQNFPPKQIEKQIYFQKHLTNTPISLKKVSQKSKNHQQTTNNSQEKIVSSKISIKRMNSLTNFDLASWRSNEKLKNSQKEMNQKKSSQITKFKGLQHQKLNDKITMIEQKVQEMKNDLIKKKQEKQRIIKQQKQERERLQKERFKNSEIERADKDKKRQDNPSVEQRIKKISITKVPYKQLIQKQIPVSVLEPKQSSIIKDVVMQIPQPKQVHQLTQNPYSPRSNIYYVSEVIKTYKDDKSLAKEHIVQSLQIMRTLENTRMPNNSQVQRRMLNLPQKKEHFSTFAINLDKKTLIFDLDETLIHCNDNLKKKFDVKIAINFDNGTVIEAGINIRPYAKEILKNLHKHFEIVVFTASQSCYADEVLDLLDPNKEYIAHRLYREHCYLSAQGMYIKDLRIINRPLSGQILVDNAAYSYFFQLQNGVPIIPYYQGSVDFELKELQRYLLQMVWEKDVRKVNRETFKLHRYIDYYNTPNKLVEDLYVNKV